MKVYEALRQISQADPYGQITVHQGDSEFGLPVLDIRVEHPGRSVQIVVAGVAPPVEEKEADPK